MTSHTPQEIEDIVGWLLTLGFFSHSLAGISIVILWRRVSALEKRGEKKSTSEVRGGDHVWEFTGQTTPEQQAYGLMADPVCKNCGRTWLEGKISECGKGGK